MPREMMFAEGIAVAITEEMQRDANVVFYGQNMAMTDRDPFVRKFGKDRVRITPISETAELGIAVGAAMALVALAYGAIFQHSLWYPVNLLSAVAMPEMAQAGLAELRAFSMSASKSLLAAPSAPRRSAIRR